jgi:hypothetical protein
MPASVTHLCITHQLAYCVRHGLPQQAPGPNGTNSAGLPAACCDMIQQHPQHTTQPTCTLQCCGPSDIASVHLLIVAPGANRVHQSRLNPGAAPRATVTR